MLSENTTKYQKLVIDETVYLNFNVHVLPINGCVVMFSNDSFEKITS